MENRPFFTESDCKHSRKTKENNTKAPLIMVFLSFIIREKHKGEKEKENFHLAFISVSFCILIFDFLSLFCCGGAAAWCTFRFLTSQSTSHVNHNCTLSSSFSFPFSFLQLPFVRGYLSVLFLPLLSV